MVAGFAGLRAPKCLRVQFPQQTGDLSVPDEKKAPGHRTSSRVSKIADNFDPVHSDVRKFYAREFFLDQDQQFELIEGIKIKIVPEVRFIRYLFDINT
jgi:hypothetical protein